MVDFVAATVLTADALDAAFNQVALNTQTGTTYTLAITDQGGAVTMANAAASTLTIPPNGTVAFPVGTVVVVAQLGAGQVTLVAGSGVTVNATPGLKLRTQFSGATCIKTGTNTWLAIGDLSA